MALQSRLVQHQLPDGQLSRVIVKKENLLHLQWLTRFLSGISAELPSGRGPSRHYADHPACHAPRTARKRAAGSPLQVRDEWLRKGNSRHCLRRSLTRDQSASPDSRSFWVSCLRWSLCLSSSWSP